MTTKDNELLARLYEKEKELLSQLESIRNTIMTLGGNKLNAESSVKINKIPVKIPKEYRPDLIWKDKILFTLNKLKKAYVSEILDYIISIDKEVEKGKEIAKRALTINASRLLKAGIIGAEEEANRNKYFLK